MLPPTGLPAEAERLLSPRPIGQDATGDAIRFGVITDRFAAGHKLKTTEYVAPELRRSHFRGHRKGF